MVTSSTVSSEYHLGVTRPHSRLAMGTLIRAGRGTRDFWRQERLQ